MLERTISREVTMGEELNYRHLSSSEREVLGRLLGASFPGCEALRGQLVSVQARYADENGGIWLRVDPLTKPADVIRRIPVEAEYDDGDGIRVHLLLHVLNGYMNELEVFREDSGPVLESADPNRLYIITHLPIG